jgi:hypothetical protein
MKIVMIVSLALLMPLQSATAAGTGAKSSPRVVAGQKIDSGLGELPHYRLWADPSGKNPMGLSKSGKSAKARAQSDAKAPAATSTQVAGLK